MRRLSASAPNAAQFSNANVAWTGGSFYIVTGNPLGNMTTANSVGSALNQLNYDQNGRLLSLPGTYNTTGQSIQLLNYGSSSDGSGGSNIMFLRMRGNSEPGANLPIQNGDQLGGLQFVANTGSGTKCFHECTI